MMKLRYSKKFLKSLRLIPRLEQEKLDQLLGTLQKNPFDPVLHVKKLRGSMTGFYSFRITRDWRVVYYFSEPGSIHLIGVKQRKDAYR